MAKKSTPKKKADKPKPNERYVSGLSDCCDAPLKEIGSGITILICSDCGQMCNKKWEEEDDDWADEGELDITED